MKPLSRNEIKVRALKFTLADLYDPNTMPKKLLDTHRDLDSAVDACWLTNCNIFPSRRGEQGFSVVPSGLIFNSWAPPKPFFFYCIA